MKKQVLSLIDTMIADVNGHFPSIYTKHDVQKLLLQLQNEIDSLEEEKQMQVNKEWIKELAQEIKDNVNDELRHCDYSELADNDTAEFYLSGNEICLERVDINIRSIQDVVDSAIDYIIDEYISDIETESKDETPIEVLKEIQ